MYNRRGLDIQGIEVGISLYKNAFPTLHNLYIHV